MSAPQYRLILSALVVLVWCSAVPAVTPSDVDKAMRFSQRGFAAFESSNLKKARLQFEKALNVVPDLPDAHLGLGHVAISENRYEDALWEYEAARDSYPKLGALLFDIEMKRFQELRNQIPRLQQDLMMIQRGDLPMSSSDQRMRISEIQQRIRDIEKMPTPTPDTVGDPPASIHFFVGNALTRLGRWEQAVESYEAAVAADPKYGQAYHNLAVAYWRAGRVEDAMNSLNRAKELGATVNPNLESDLRKAYSDAQDAKAAKDAKDGR